MKTLLSLMCNKTVLRFFAFSATVSLLPLALLAYLSFHEISNRLLEQNYQQLQQISKATGNTIMDRLNNLQHELSNVASQFLTFNATNKLIEQFNIDDEIKNDFSAIVVNSKENHYIPLFNGIDEFPKLSQKQIDHLQNGNPLLVFSDYSNFQKKILLIISLDTAASNPEYIIAEINQKKLWNFDDIIYSPTFGCISTEKHETLFCTSSNISHDYLSYALTKNNETSATFTWKEDNITFIAFYWTIFLEGKFGTESWLVVLSAPKLEEKFAIETIKAVYPKVILFALLVSVLAAIVQFCRKKI